MAHSNILFEGSAHEKVLRGAMQWADAIRISLRAQLQVGADSERLGPWGQRCWTHKFGTFKARVERYGCVGRSGVHGVMPEVSRQ